MLQILHASLLALLHRYPDDSSPPPALSQPLFYHLGSLLSPSPQKTPRALYDLLLPYEPEPLLALRPILSSKPSLLAVCNTFPSFEAFFNADLPDSPIAIDLLALLLKRLLLSRSEALLTTHSCHPHHVLALLRLLSGSEISGADRDLLPLSPSLLQVLFFEDLQEQKMHYFSRLSHRNRAFLLKFTVLESALNAIQGGARAKLSHLLPFPQGFQENSRDSYAIILPILYQGLTTAAGPNFVWQRQSPSQLAAILAEFLCLAPHASLRDLIQNSENLECAEDYLRWIAVLTLLKYRARYTQSHSLAFHSLLHSLQNPALSASHEAQALAHNIFHTERSLWRLPALEEFPSALPLLSFSHWQQSLLSCFHPGLYLQRESTTLAIGRAHTDQGLFNLLGSVAPLSRADCLTVDSLSPAEDGYASSAPWQGFAKWQGAYPLPKSQREEDSEETEIDQTRESPQDSLQVFIDERRWLEQDRRPCSRAYSPFLFREKLAISLDFEKMHWLASMSSLWRALADHQPSGMLKILKKSSAFVLGEWSQVLRSLEQTLRQAANALRDNLIEHTEVELHTGTRSSFLTKLCAQIAQDNAFEGSRFLSHLQLIYKNWRESEVESLLRESQSTESESPHAKPSLSTGTLSEEDFSTLMTNPSWLSYVILNHHGLFIYKLCTLYRLESSILSLLHRASELYPLHKELLWPWILETHSLDESSLGSALFEAHPIDFLQHCLKYHNTALALYTLRANPVAFSHNGESAKSLEWALGCADSYLLAPEVGLGSLVLVALQYTLFSLPNYTQRTEAKGLHEKVMAVSSSQEVASSHELSYQLKTLLQRLTPKDPSAPSRARRKSFIGSIPSSVQVGASSQLS